MEFNIPIGTEKSRVKIKTIIRTNPMILLLSLFLAVHRFFRFTPVHPPVFEDIVKH